MNLIRNYAQALNRKPVLITDNPQEISDAMFPAVTVKAAFLLISSAKAQELRDQYAAVTDIYNPEYLDVARPIINGVIDEEGSVTSVTAFRSGNNLDRGLAVALLQNFNDVFRDNFPKRDITSAQYTAQRSFHQHDDNRVFATFPVATSRRTTVLPGIVRSRYGPMDSIFFGGPRTRHKSPNILRSILYTEFKPIGA